MTALLRYPGAKWAMAEQIIQYFPKHKGYLEPYFGSGGVLFTKQKCNLETVNDIDNEVINFFQVLKSNYIELKAELQNTPYARNIYLSIQETIPTSNLERAYKFFIMSWMSHAGYQPHCTGWSHSKNPNGPNKATIFKNVVDSLEQFAERLREVQVENTDALGLIKTHDFKDTLIYMDPPYVTETRKPNLYKHEMTDKDHKRLLETVVKMKAKILISGYDNSLYNEVLKDWNKLTFPAIDGKGNQKQEVVWFNYDIIEQQKLF
jgi:DNA adenine methylase